MKISIAMTTYNGMDFLAEQLDSIFAQSRLPDELIVCDDRSTDRTVELLRDYAARSPFEMKVIVNDERLGSTKNFENAIALCSGELIVLCDQDDVWRPHKLEVFERIFAADTDLGVVLTNADLIDERGRRLRGDLWSRSRLNEGRQRALLGSHRYDVLFGLPFTTGATMAFRSIFKPLVMPFPVGAPTFIHDRWIAVVIAAVGGIAVLQEKLLAYRLHGKQQLGVGLPLPLKVFVPYRCRSDSLALKALDERLRSNPGWSTKPGFRQSLVVRRRHIAARARFSRNPLRRLKQVAKEYRSGRYIRYPYGLIVSLQDLLVGTR